jgi:hypothetical protein
MILSKNQCCFRRGHSTLAVRKLFVVVLLISARHLILFGELVFGKNYLIIVLIENVLKHKCTPCITPTSQAKKKTKIHSLE